MQVHVLQHVSFEGLGSIAPFLDARRARISHTRFFEAHRLPDSGSIDMVVVMGGPMSTNDEETLPWLIEEKQFLRDAIVRGIPVLGICLGAQLIAAALGAEVSRNPVKEIGWFPVHAVPAPAENFHFPEECMAFHWHGETFDLPPGAVRLAESAGCKNQAFQFNRNVLGLQFHLETTIESAAALLDNCRNDLTAGPYVQSEAELRAVPSSSYREINAAMNEVLSYLLR
jgi:GMP synthase-like glutamine amidotransferase